MVSTELDIFRVLQQFEMAYFGAWDAIATCLTDEDSTVAMKLNTLWTARRRG